MSRLLSRLAAPAALLVTLLAASAASAQAGLDLRDPFARLTPQAGAVYLMIQNHADAADRLLSASSPQAGMVMLMTTTETDGVSSMANADAGLDIPAEGTLVLEPGQGHIMLMGLKGKFREGDTIEVTLTFANSGPVTMTVPVLPKRTDPPADVDTAFNAETQNTAQDASAKAGDMSMPMSDDQSAIIALLKAQFEKPESPLTVDPVVVVGDDALASWVQGEMAGRALLRRMHGHWSVVLCAGPDLRAEDFLARHGVADAAALSQMFNTAEDGLGADKVGLFSTFDGVVEMSAHGSN